MAQIIPFPVTRTNAYLNLTRLIEIADTAASLNFYMESIGAFLSTGYITDAEAKKLTRQGRAKCFRKEEHGAVAKREADLPGTYLYTPELGEQQPECQMEASGSHYGHHYYVDTPLELNGRGITKLSDPCWIDGSRKQVEGWKSYRVTNKAFEKLKQKYSISMASYLD